METNYIIIFDYSAGEVIKIKLTKEQIEESYKYDDFEAFLETLEDKYDFKLNKVLIYISTLENLRKAGVGKSSNQSFLFY